MLDSYVTYQGMIMFFVLLILSVFVILQTILWILKSPFKYPYFIQSFDVSNKRNPQIMDYIDNYLIEGNFSKIQQYNEKIKSWKNESELKVEKCFFKKYRKKQFEKCLDDAHAFKFTLTRQQTRYEQHNYVKTSYKVSHPVKNFYCDYVFLINRNEKLKSIDYECTLREYETKNQRKLMTKQLKDKIKQRDNYTCQICKKYMPDEVGLHVDHIIPVSKGGKSVESNLQVLCSKCNAKKSNKLEVN